MKSGYVHKFRYITKRNSPYVFAIQLDDLFLLDMTFSENRQQASSNLLSESYKTLILINFINEVRRNNIIFANQGKT